MTDSAPNSRKRIYTWDLIKAGAILLADLGYSDYATLAQMTSRGVDVNTRLHQGRDPDSRRGKRLGPGERLRVFTKPVQRPKSLARRIWNKLVPEVTVRLINDALLGDLAEDLVPERPGRREPRAVKRRPKPFAQLNQHRKIYQKIEHRNRWRKKGE